MAAGLSNPVDVAVSRSAEAVGTASAIAKRILAAFFGLKPFHRKTTPPGEIRTILVFFANTKYVVLRNNHERRDWRGPSIWCERLRRSEHDGAVSTRARTSRVELISKAATDTIFQLQGHAACPSGYRLYRGIRFFYRTLTLSNRVSVEHHNTAIVGILLLLFPSIPSVDFRIARC